MSRKLNSEFQERTAEVDAYLDFLLTVEEQARQGAPRIIGAAHPISTQQQRILYSTVYLQLYNLVEATMSGCIDAIAEAAMDNDRWKPSDLSDSLRREWVRMTARTHVEMNPEKRLVHALHLCDHLIKSLQIITFKLDKGGGGNWDDDAIEALSERLGVELDVSQPIYSAIKQPFRDDLGPLALVKEFRNRLAHGSISFAQCAENTTVDRLVDLKDTTVNYLGEVVACFSRYVENREFLLPEKRPVR